MFEVVSELSVFTPLALILTLVAVLAVFVHIVFGLVVGKVGFLLFIVFLLSFYIIVFEEIHVRIFLL